jgi:hypothetical protein
MCASIIKLATQFAHQWCARWPSPSCEPLRCSWYDLSTTIVLYYYFHYWAHRASGVRSSKSNPSCAHEAECIAASRAGPVRALPRAHHCSRHSTLSFNLPCTARWKSHVFLRTGSITQSCVESNCQSTVAYTVYTRSTLHGTQSHAVPTVSTAAHVITYLRATSSTVRRKRMCAYRILNWNSNCDVRHRCRIPLGLASRIRVLCTVSDQSLESLHFHLVAGAGHLHTARQMVLIMGLEISRSGTAAYPL